jgi:hypothetical protein
MENEFVTYEQALALKELGFNEKCCGYYLVRTLFITSVLVYDSQEIPVVKAPLKQQVFRWFREKYGFCHFVNHSGHGFCSGWEDKGYNEHGFENFNTYEEAENACIDKLIEIAKQNNDTEGI